MSILKPPLRDAARNLAATSRKCPKMPQKSAFHHKTTKIIVGKFWPIKKLLLLLQVNIIH